MTDRTVPPQTLTVATLNVGGLRRPRPPLVTLDRRAAELGQRLEASGADVLNLQEMHYPEWVEVMRANLPSYPYLACRRGLYGPAGGLVIFSRRPLGPPSYRSFGPVLPTMGDAAFRLRRAVVSALQGVLTVELADLPVTVVNTHLSANKDGDWSVDNRYYEFHRRQLRRLNAVLARPRRTGLMIVTGDYNIASSSTHYPLIVNGLRDPFAEADPTTFHAAFLDDRSPHRIDYVLLDGAAERFPVLAARPYLDSPECIDGEERYLSDHVALVVQVGLGFSNDWDHR